MRRCWPPTPPCIRRKRRSGGACDRARILPCPGSCPSRSTQSAGTAIPVVRESEFRTSAANLLNVPVDPLFRLTFRIYEMNIDRADFTVRVFDQETGALLQTRTVTTTTTGPQGVLRF